MGVVTAAVAPELPGMSRLAERLAARSFSPRRDQLAAALLDARRERDARGGGPIIALLPSTHPALIPLAARRADRVALYHAGPASRSSFRQAILRAAFSLVDRTIVPDAEALASAIQLGADPDRISLALDDDLERALLEPRRSDPIGGAVEAATSLALDAAERIGAVRLAELFAPTKGVNVINYHRVLPLDELRSYGRPQMAIAAPLFEAQLAAIADRHGFTGVEHARDPAARGKVAITFDDGYEDNFRIALPILQRFSTPACIFMVTSLIGRPDALWWDRVGLALFAFWRSGCPQPIPADLPARARALPRLSSFEEARGLISEVLGELNDADDAGRAQAVAAAEALVPSLRPTRTMLSWEEVRQMQRLGIRFGSHTRNHVCLDQVPAETAREEIFGSQTDLEARLGPGSARLTALPRGKMGPIGEDELRQFGFVAVMTTDAGVNSSRDRSLFVRRRDGKYLTLRGRHHPAKLRLELSGIVDRFRRP